MDKLSIGKRVRELRKERKLTLVEVAGVEFTKGYISQVELGKVNPSMKALSHIAKKLGIKVEELISIGDKLDHQLAAIENELACKRYKSVIKLSKGIALNGNDPIITKIKLMESKACYYLNNYDECINLAKEILKVDQEWSLNYRLEAYSFIGVSLFAKGSYGEVIELYDEIFDFAYRNGLSDSKLLANMYLNKASALQNLGRYKEAIKKYNETLDFAREHECMETVLDAFLRIGYCYYKIDNLELAKKYIHDGLRINRILGIELPQAEAFLILGYIMMAQKNFRAAEILLNKALPLFKKLDWAQGVLETLFLLSKVFIETNRSGEEKILECVEVIQLGEIEMFNQTLLKDIAKSCMDLGLHEKASGIFSKLVD